MVGGSFVVGIGVGGSGRSNREKIRHPAPSFRLLLPPESRRWTTMAEEESARLWQVNRTIHEQVKDRVSDESVSNSIAMLNS